MKCEKERLTGNRLSIRMNRDLMIPEMSGRVTLIFVLVLLVFQFFTFVRGQSTPEGFLNIDCGLPKDRTYNNTVLGLPYISDYEFTDTGESHSVSPDLFVADSPTSYLRSFPNGTRNCYKIKPVVVGWKYLVRARFRYGNYDGLNRFPRFDLYLGINYWGTLYKGDVNTIYNLEIIAVAVSNSISVCLVNTKQGIPFISAIELRHLPNTLYSEVNTSQSLARLTRQNLGGNFSRYPDDIYDRFWFTDKDEIPPPAVKTFNTSSTVLTSSFEEPLDVMQTLVYPNETATDLTSKFSTESVGSCPSNRAYFVLYFAELENLMTNESRILHVLVNGVVISGEIQPEYLKTIVFEKSISFSEDQLMLSVANVSGSTKPPILNALEVYRIIDMTCQSETRTLDIDAITGIKAFYRVKRNWNGDPCAPKDFMWEGLNCTFNGSNSPSITSLDLSSSDLSGGIPASFAKLTALNYLDLSSNSLTGEIPDFLSTLAQLKVLNLAKNSLTGSIPKVLLDMSSKGQLNLSTGGNPNLCTNPDSCPEERSKKNNIVLTVDVSSIVVVVLVVLVLIFVCRCKRKRSTGGGSRLSLVHTYTRKLTYDKLKEITDNFKKEIGSGGFGQVFLGKFGNTQIAVKLLRESTSLAKGLEGFQTEAKLLSKIHHKNLVKLIGYCDDDIKHLALVYEYMEGGSLHDHLSDANKRKELSWRKCLQIAREVAEGLEYLHKGCDPPIIHRDIKPGNILLTKELEARIGDFGLSKLFESDSVNATHMSRMGVAGTPGFCDPEYVKTNELRDKSDVYSFGVVLMVLITGLPEIMTIIDRKVPIADWVRERLLSNEIEEIIDKRIKEEYDEKSALNFVKIAEKCTRKETHDRPDITKVVEDLEQLCTAYEESHPPTSGNPQQQPLVVVVGSHGEEADDVPLCQSSDQSHSYSKSKGLWKKLKTKFLSKDQFEFVELANKF